MGDREPRDDESADARPATPSAAAARMLAGLWLDLLRPLHRDIPGPPAPGLVSARRPATWPRPRPAGAERDEQA